MSGSGVTAAGIDALHARKQPGRMSRLSAEEKEQFGQILDAGLFLECHPDPKNARSDAATMLRTVDVEPLLKQCTQIAQIRSTLEF